MSQDPLETFSDSVSIAPALDVFGECPGQSRDRHNLVAAPLPWVATR